jgi:hypothetical protein
MNIRDSKDWIGAREKVSKTRSCLIAEKHVIKSILERDNGLKHVFLVNLAEAESQVAA